MTSVRWVSPNLVAVSRIRSAVRLLPVGPRRGWWRVGGCGHGEFPLQVRGV